MGRNVVTVAPRSRSPRPAYRQERARILAEVAKWHRPTPHNRGDWLHLDFSRREDPKVVYADVVGWLDSINPSWSRYVKVYGESGLPPRGGPLASAVIAAIVGVWFLGLATIVGGVGYLIYRFG